MNLIDLNIITIGSDPEFFIVDKKGDAFPSIGIFNGTKDSPEDQGGGFALLKDNVLVEGNIPPAKNVEEFVESMKTLKSMMNSVLAVAGLQLHSADSMKFKPRFLDHPEANVFGCSSYKNAWKVGKFSAENMSFMPQRVCGHHHHIGYQLVTDLITQKQMNRYIAKAFDYFVVYPARQHHNDEFRARYYGNYGVYRHCPSYGGVECRALGGHFTADEHLSWTYEQTIKAVQYCSNSDNLLLLNEAQAPITEDSEFTMTQYELLGIDLNEQLIKEDARAINIVRDCEVSQM